MPSLATGCLPPCLAGGTSCEGGKVIQPCSFWPDLHQRPIAFYRSAKGSRGAPAVQLWATWTRAQQEVAWDNGIHCTRVFFVDGCAGNSDPHVAVLMSPHSSHCSPPLNCEWLMQKATHTSPGTKLITASLTFPLYQCISAWDPLCSHCSLKWKGYCFPSVPSNCFICLCLPVSLLGKAVCTDSFEEGIYGIYLLHTEKSGASLLSLLLTLKENRKKIKVAFAAQCCWYSYSMGKTWYIHLLSEPLLRDLSEWASYENRYPSVEIDVIICVWYFLLYSTDCLCCWTTEKYGFPHGGKDCCNTPLLSSSGTSY